MINYQFERNARRNRNKALIFTIAFHACLLGGLLFAGDVDWHQYVPQAVQQWLGMDSQHDVSAKLPDDRNVVIRP